MTAIATRSAPSTAVPPLTRRDGRTRETLIFWIGLALIALHVLDDNFVQPPAGTSPGHHLVSGLVPLALLGLAAWAYPRLSGGRRGALSLFAGVLGIIAAMRGVPLHDHRPAPPATTSPACSPLLAGLVLLGLGVAHALADPPRRGQPRLALPAPRRCSASPAPSPSRSCSSRSGWAT